MDDKSGMSNGSISCLSVFVCVMDECIGPELTRPLRSGLLGALGDVHIELSRYHSWMECIGWRMEWTRIIWTALWVWMKASSRNYRQRV